MATLSLLTCSDLVPLQLTAQRAQRDRLAFFVRHAWVLLSLSKLQPCVEWQSVCGLNSQLQGFLWTRDWRLGEPLAKRVGPICCCCLAGPSVLSDAAGRLARQGSAARAPSRS